MQAEFDRELAGTRIVLQYVDAVWMHSCRLCWSSKEDPAHPDRIYDAVSAELSAVPDRHA